MGPGGRGGGHLGHIMRLCGELVHPHSALLVAHCQQARRAADLPEDPGNLSDLEFGFC